MNEWNDDDCVDFGDGQCGGDMVVTEQSGGILWHPTVTRCQAHAERRVNR
jgi:hypothetical protein